LEELNQFIQKRGPDIFGEEVINCEHVELRFRAHVLHLRGELTKQPLKDKRGNILCWNGEIFGGIEVDFFFFFFKLNLSQSKVKEKIHI